MKHPPLDSFSATRWTRVHAALATALGSLAVATPSHAQNYQMQGPNQVGPAQRQVFSGQSAYGQMGAPPAGTGMTSQPVYVQPSYQQPAYQVPYQQQPKRPTVIKSSKPTYTSQWPSYNQQPQPYAYPPGPAYTQPKTQPYAGPVYQLAPKPKPVSNRLGSSSMAQDIEQLKASDRSQNARLDRLESKTPAGNYVPSTPTSYVKYVVREGNSLQSIADRHGASVAAIRNANHLPSNIIYEGQTLMVPVKGSMRSGGSMVSQSNGAHIVQRGESLSQIAQQYGMSLNTLQNANGIRNPDLVVVGQRLVIPGRAGNASPGKLSTRKSTVATSSNYNPNRYVSKPAKTKTADSPPPADMGIVNGAILAPSDVSSRGVASHRVEPEDTWESVAKSYGTTSEAIKRKNKMTTLPPVGEEVFVTLPGSVSS